MRLLDHEHGTVYLSSSPTARHLLPSRNISRLIYSAYLFRARIDCVKCPCSSPGRLRRYNSVKLHYVTYVLTYLFNLLQAAVEVEGAERQRQKSVKELQDSLLAHVLRMQIGLSDE